MAAFTVDTKLFQELGELLVAKEATALVELIKNAYDADATVVTVRGTNLRDAAAGSIVVEDDGVGMSESEFEKGFLRIAGRSKVSGDRRSAAFGRRFTGEKGVGRLAAHKLARALQVHSRKAAGVLRGQVALPAAEAITRARIDWDRVEAVETLDRIAASGAVEVQTKELGEPQPSGTTLTMAPLRRVWTPRMVETFLREAVTLAPVKALWQQLPPNLTSEPLLFDTVPVRDQQNTDPGFEIQFVGDLSIPDVVTPDIAQTAGWIAEIEFLRESGDLRVAIAPTSATLRKYPTSESFHFTRKLSKGAGPSFRARILQREGAWDPAVQGIRIFMEGFRVPPYGDLTDDWLSMDRAYRVRGHRKLTSLDRTDIKDLPSGLEKEELALQSSPAYMGAVFLHRTSTPELEMLVNREGFLPGPGLDFIAEWVRVTTDLIVRLGYASRKEVKQVREIDRKVQRLAAQRADVSETPAALRVRESALAVADQLSAVRAALETKNFQKAADAAQAAQPHLQTVQDLSERFGSEAIMWRVLASLGTELAAFVHEINALALEAAVIVGDLDEALHEIRSREPRSKVQRARKTALAMAERIRRNATYLVDATSFEGRKRRSRLPLRERFEAVLPFPNPTGAEKKIELSDTIPEALRTPPMFPAELAGIFTNLLSNAVKFTEEEGRIKVTAEELGDMLYVTIENSGVSVDLGRSEKLFEAFHSTTERPDAVLGQGMGMGLTITRAFIQEYGGVIEFVAPSPTYATAIRWGVHKK